MTDKLGWRPGYTRGISEGKWTREESTKMRYERANPQHYDSPQTTAYAANYERIFGRARAESCDSRCEFSPGHAGRCAWNPGEVTSHD